MNLDPDKLVGHAHLATGQLVTVEVTGDDEVIVALYAIPEEEPTDDAPITPAPVLHLSADEAELIGGLCTLAAVTAYSRRNRL
jgi:hypothetical protein